MKVSIKPHQKLKIITNGIGVENPVFRLVLGTCPTLATSTSFITGVSMGAGVIFVLVFSNMLISLLRNVISDKIRIPAYITIIATFVTVVDRVMAKFLPGVYSQLGIFIPLIVVNCIILARAEAFASKNNVFDSMLDGLGMGLGFTVSIGTIALVREFLGAGSVMGYALPGAEHIAMTIFILPAGGFLTYGFLMAGLNHISAKRKEKKQTSKTLHKEVI